MNKFVQNFWLLTFMEIISFHAIITTKLSHDFGYMDQSCKVQVSCRPTYSTIPRKRAWFAPSIAKSPNYAQRRL
jgi:hypothetical protein